MEAIERPNDDDAPIPLADACQLFPLAGLTVSTLRAEAACGRLDNFKIGRRHFTTPQSMRDMVRLCREGNHRRGSISTRREANGSSETAQRESALAALRQSVGRPKNA